MCVSPMRRGSPCSRAFVAVKTLDADPVKIRAAFQTTPALSVTSATSSPSLPSPSLMEEDAREHDHERDRDGKEREAYGGYGRGRYREREREEDADMTDREREASGSGAGAAGGEEWKSLSRVSNLPLVNTALRAYEQSKASSRVVKVRRCLGRFSAVGGRSVRMGERRLIVVFSALSHSSAVRCGDDGVVDEVHLAPRDRPAARRTDRRVCV